MQTNDYYQSNYYGNRGYTRGRGRQRGRGRGRGNYSYNYRYKEDYLIEKELNPTIHDTNSNLKPENLEDINAKPIEETQNISENVQKENKPIAQASPKKLLNAFISQQNDYLHKSPSAAKNVIANSDSEYAIENFLSSNENKNNKFNKESPQKTISANTNINLPNNDANEQTQHHHQGEKSTIFINNAISNTNQSKLKNLFETNKERDSAMKNIPHEIELQTKDEKQNKTSHMHHIISNASNFEFNSKPVEPNQNQVYQIISNSTNNKQANLHRNLIQESSSELTFNKSTRGKFEENAISVENNSFGVYSAPKKESIVSSHQAHNFTFNAQIPQQNKFNAAVPQNKNIIIPNTNLSALNQNLAQQQIPNLNNLNKTNQQQLNSKNEPSFNSLNLNSSPNMQFNPMMPNANIQQDLSAAGFPFAGANPSQQGIYPMLCYYPPTQGGNLEQYSNMSNASLGANPQMPFMPYPMGYYFNPYMFGGQQDLNKDENTANANAKARKNVNYANVSAYHGMNQNVDLISIDFNFSII